ncbi:MAG: glycogen/starch synthase [bacterium]|nr:glycogen/starch synthase [bacterium]
MAKPLSVLLVSSEVYPFIKTSELADLCYAHSLGVREIGHDIRVMMPKYGFISERKNRIHEINRLRDIPIPVGPESFPATVKSSSINNPRVKVQAYITTNTNFLDVNKGLMADNTTGVEFPNNDERFIFFNRTVLETCMLLGWFPDVIHCVGWATALIPAYIRTQFPNEFRKTKIVMTISDFLDQGVFPIKSLAKTGLNEEAQAIGKYKSKANFLRIGLAYADRVTTLSSEYAAELLANKEFKENWLPLLNKKPLTGIPHGVDLMQWNPKTDTMVKPKFDVKDTSGKQTAKELLQRLSDLPDRPDSAIASFVGPLTEARGADIIAAAIPELVKENLQIIIATEIPSELMKSFEALVQKYPHNVALKLCFDEEYLHALMAGSTLLLKPSRQEVSGQFQRIALVYGTIPVIHGVGGLTEGLTDVDEEKQIGNAFILKKGDATDLVKTVKRALKIREQQAVWNSVVQRAMTTNVGWGLSAIPYDELYRNLMKETK